MTDVTSAARFRPFDPSSQRVRRILGWLILAGGMAWLTFGVFAARGPSGPLRITAPVTDRAGVIGVAEARMIDAALRRLRAETGVQMAVLTVTTTGGVPIDDFSYSIAEGWGGGQAGRDDGVLFVLAVQDRRMRLEVGRGLEAQITDGDAARFIGELPPLLRAGRYGAAAARMVDRVAGQTGGAAEVEAALPASAASTLGGGSVRGALARAYRGAMPWPHLLLVAGLLIVGWRAVQRFGLSRGLRAAAKRARFYEGLRAWPHAAVGLVAGSAMVAGLVQAFALDARGDVVSVPLIIGFMGLAVGIPIVAWSRKASLRHWRVQPRGCAEGDGMLRQVGPDGAEGGLSAGQQTEVAILSREYDVWICPNGHRQVEGFRGSSPADDCPRCDFATVRRSSWRTVESATYTRSGLKKRDVDCKHCSYSTTESAVIPRKQRSSSTGGGSSGSSGGGWSGGGGSFGGGGASGSW